MISPGTKTSLQGKKVRNKQITTFFSENKSFFWQTGPIYLRRITYSIWLIVYWILCCYHKSQFQYVEKSLISKSELAGYNNTRFLRPNNLCLTTFQNSKILVKTLLSQRLNWIMKPDWPAEKPEDLELRRVLKWWVSKRQTNRNIEMSWTVHHLCK